MLESIEKVSSIVARYTEIETRLLLRVSVLTNQLSVALVKLYTTILLYFVRAQKYYTSSTFSK